MKQKLFSGKFSIFLICILFFSIAVSGQRYPSSFNDGKYYTVNGSKIWTVSFGKGEPLFFISGGPGGAHFGMRSFDTLSTSNTLVYFDGFGRGKSDVAKQVSEYTLERDVEDLEIQIRVPDSRPIDRSIFALDSYWVEVKS